MTAIDCRHHTMYLHPTVYDRQLDDLRAITAVPCVEGDATKPAGRRRRAPARLFCRRVEYGQISRTVEQQSPPVEERIHSGSVRHLIDETYPIVGVLYIIDPAPQTRR